MARDGVGDLLELLLVPGEAVWSRHAVRYGVQGRLACGGLETHPMVFEG